MSGFLALIHAVSVGYFAARAAFGIVLFSRPGPGQPLWPCCPA
jgi:hypothetical protein